MLSEREEAIDHFEPRNFYTVKLVLGGGLVGIPTASGPERSPQPDGVQQGQRRGETVEHKEKRKTRFLYDLTTLSDANLGYTAQQTLEYAQSLYEKRLLTIRAQTAVSDP